MKKFSEYIIEVLNPKEIVFSFGRFNPPTNGHEKLLDKVASVTKGSTYRIYPSHSSDPKKNPLGWDEKIKFMRKMFPKHARSIIADKSIKTAIDVVNKLYEEGYTKVSMVVGSDRISEFDTLLNKYNGVKGRHGFYNFKEGITIVSAGERDPDSDDVDGMSASKLRGAASNNDLETFSKGMPNGYKEAQKLLNAIRKGMGLKESYDFRRHIKLESVSEERESYIRGELFKEGDLVESKGDDQYGQVVLLGSNYVLIEYTNGNRKRKWLSDVKLVSEEVLKENEEIKLDESDLDIIDNGTVQNSKHVLALRAFNISEMKITKPITTVASLKLNSNKYSTLMQKMHEERKGKKK